MKGLLSLSGHGVTLFPNRVLYSHTGPVGTAEDLSSQMTKSKLSCDRLGNSGHVQGHVIGLGVLGYMIDQVTWSCDLSLSNLVCFLNRKVEFLMP